LASIHGAASRLDIPPRAGEPEQVAQVDPLVVGVDVEAVAAEESDERDAEPVGGLDGEVGRRRDGTDDRDAGDRRLLDDLEAHPTADHQDPVVKRHAARQELGADELVERVVAAHILAKLEQLAGRREETRGVEPARLVERALGRAEQLRQREDDRPRDHWTGGDRIRPHRDLVERGLAADPARRRRDEVALGDARRVERPREVDRDLIVRLVHAGGIAHRRPEHLGPFDQALGPEESDRELVLVTGRAHRDRDRDRLLARARGADLERLLAHDAVATELDGRAPNRDDAGRRHVSRGRAERVDVHDPSVARAPRLNEGDGRPSPR
jgi:hypothetical protein